MQLSPNQLVAEAYNETGAFGIGQTPRATDLSSGLTRLGLMLTEWQEQKYMVFHEVERLCPVTPGKPAYSVGEGGDFDTGVDSLRPARLESAWYRLYQQTVPEGIGSYAIGTFGIGLGVPGQNALDFPLRILAAREDYSALQLKQFGAFPEACYYDPAFPLGNFIPWPLPTSGQPAAFGITLRAQLPRGFIATPDALFNLPDVYYSALMLGLALRLCSRMRLPPPPLLPLQAKQAMATLRGANFSVPSLRLGFGRGGAGANIFTGA